MANLMPKIVVFVFVFVISSNAYFYGVL